MPGDPNRPASEKQLAALRRFGAKIPDGLTVGVASEWMDYLVKKVQAGRQIDDQDRAGPPNFHPASKVPPAPPAPVAPPPSSSPTPPPASNPDPLPTSDDWITVIAEREEELAGGVKVKRTAKFAGHAAPGETYERAADRLMKKAEKAVGL
jgi:hypothetical protein